MINIASSQEFESSQENVYAKTNLGKIPKLKPSTELLKTIEEDDKFDYLQIKNAIFQSFADKNSTRLAHSLTRIQLINNSELENIYETYKRERKSKEEQRVKREKRRAVKFAERDLFLFYFKEDKAIDIAKNGLECEEAEFNYLGDSKLGIHFSKNLDILLKYVYLKFNLRKEIYCIIVKAFYDPNKLFPLKFALDNSASGASIDHDGHIPHVSLNDMTSLKPVYNQFGESLIFLYDVDPETCEYLPKPRNLLPYAILKYEYKQDVQLLRDIKNTIKTTKTAMCAPVNTRNAFTNRSRYFNQINNTAKSEIVKETPTEKKSASATIKFVQADYIPLFGEAKPQVEQQPAPVVLTETKASEYDLFIEQARKRQQELQAPKEAQPDDFDACRLVSNFRPKTPPPQATSDENKVIYSDDEEDLDELKLLEEYFIEYADIFNESKEKLPKWRIMFERTGNVDHIFRAGRRMECKMNDLKNMGFKYLNEDKTKIRVSDFTNKFILDYESKRIKKSQISSQSTHDSDENNKEACSKLVDCENAMSSKIVRLKIGENNYVNVDFSYLPLSSLDLKQEIGIKTEKLNTESSKLQLAKTTQLKPKTNTNKPSADINSNNKFKPSTSQSTIKKETNVKPKPPEPSKTPKIKEEKKTDTEPSSHSKVQPSKEAVERFKAKVAANKSTTLQQQQQTESDTSSKKATIKTSASSTNLSSENTSLESRLLNIDKSKPTIKQEPTVPKEPQLTKPIEPTITRSNNIKEDMKKLLEKYRAKTAAKEKEEHKNENKAKQLLESIKSTEEMMKKKKSFWDPDSDTEYDKLRNSTATTSSGIIANDDEDEDDDIVIVSKQNLNLPPLQYSKQFYDLNINGFEAELRKFSPAYVSSCSSSPLNNNLSICNNTVTTVTKSPIKSKNKQTQQQQQQQQNQQQSRRFRLNNRQRYIHHIVVNSINSHDPSVNQFDVDGLRHLKSRSQNNLSCTSGETAASNVIEIHSGGFRCIEEHNFQQSANYLRRTKSFDTNKFNDFALSSSKQKISLNDYVNTRKSTTTLTTVAITTPTTTNINDTVACTSSSIMNVPVVVSANSDDSIKREPVSPSRVEQACTQPLRQSIESTVLPPFYKKAQQFPSLSLIDELKKRINKKEDKQSLYTNQRLIKEDDLYDDDELKRLQCEHSKLKRSHHHHKKREKSKKKMKLDSNENAVSLQDDEEAEEDEEEDDDDENYSMSTCTSASFSSELLFDDDDENLSFSSDSSISSFTSLDSSEASESTSVKKKHKHKSKHAKKRKLSNTDDGELDSSQSKSKKKSNKKHKSSRHHKSSKRKHHQISQTSSTNSNEKSNQTVMTMSTNSKLMTHDDDYSMGDLNLDVFADRDLSNKNESTDKTLESSTNTTAAQATTTSASNTASITTTKTSESNLTDEVSKELDKTLVEPPHSVKQTENYDNFYSEYDIDDAAVLFNTTPTALAASSSTCTFDAIMPKSEPKSPSKTNDSYKSTTPHSTTFDSKPTITTTTKPTTPSVLGNNSKQQSSPLLQQPTTPISQASKTNNNNNNSNTNLSNAITTPKTAPTQSNLSRLQHQKQNFYTPNVPSNRPRPQTNHNNKMNYNSNNNNINNNNNSKMHSNRSYMNPMMPNMSVGLDVTTGIMPNMSNMNYMTPNNYDPMNQMNYQNNLYNNYSSFDDFDFQYSMNSNNNNNYQYSQMNNYPYPNNNNNTNSNYSSWHSCKDKYYNNNNTFNNNNNNNNYQNFNQQRNNYPRNFNNNNNNRMNRQQTSQQSRSNTNMGNSINSNFTTNKRAQNHDQEDGEIVD